MMNNRILSYLILFLFATNCSLAISEKEKWAKDSLGCNGERNIKNSIALFDSLQGKKSSEIWINQETAPDKDVSKALDVFYLHSICNKETKETICKIEVWYNDADELKFYQLSCKPGKFFDQVIRYDYDIDSILSLWKIGQKPCINLRSKEMAEYLFKEFKLYQKERNEIFDILGDPLSDKDSNPILFKIFHDWCDESGKATCLKITPNKNNKKWKLGIWSDCWMAIENE